MRTSDWSPLADSDPVPGDPISIRELADHLVGVAEAIRSQNERMGQIDAGAVWESEAAEKFIELQGKLPPDLELAASRYEKVSNALSGYESELSGAQSDADDALTRAKAAQDDLEYAERGIEQMEEWRDEAERLADEHNAANPDSPAQPEPWTGTDYVSLKSDAEDRLSRARDDLDDAVSRRNSAADEAESTIDDAAHDDLKNPGGLMGWIKDNAGWLLKVSDILSVVGAVLGVLSIFFPVLAPLALAVGALSLLLNAALASAGEKGWGDFWLDAVGMATFGLGRAFSLAGRVARARPFMNAANTAFGEGTTALRGINQARNARSALLARPNLRGLRATGLRGQPIYGNAARNRLLAQYDDALRTNRAAYRQSGLDQWNALNQYGAIRYPPRNPWQGWSNVHNYAGRNALDYGRDFTNNGWQGFVGQSFDITSTAGVGVAQGVDGVQGISDW